MIKRPSSGMLYAIAREACMFERFISYFRRRSIPAESGLWFDAHCHVFNVEYLALEASRMLFDIIRGTYPLAWKEAPDLIGSAKGSRRGARRADPRDSARKFLAWAMELLDAGTDSEERNGEFITETGMAAFSRAEFGFVPLMMDIYYMQAGALGPANASARANGPEEATTPTMDSRWGSDLSSLRKDLAAMSTTAGDELSRLGSLLGEAHDKARKAVGIDELARALVERAEDKFRLDEEERYEGLFLTPGFKRQIKAAAALGAAFPGRAFPFFAVDPRRPGAVEAVCSGKITGKEGPFYGVKLYPRLGYHPGCAELQPLYRYCSENSVPITSHTSYKGFPDFMMDHADFGDPLYWEPIVKAYPKLRLDLAHFGARTEDPAWHETVARLIRENTNVFSDLSCYTKAEEIDFIADAYMKDGRIRSRVMFGSDFDVMYFLSPGEITLQSYYLLFLERLGAKTLQTMCATVPRKFLFG